MWPEETKEFWRRRIVHLRNETIIYEKVNRPHLAEICRASIAAYERLINS